MFDKDYNVWYNIFRKSVIAFRRALRMKKCCLLWGMIFLCLLLVACQPRPSAEETLRQALEALKAQDQQKMAQYFDVDMLTGEEDSSFLLSGFDYTQLLKNFSYEILDCTESEDTARARVSVCNIDMSALLSDFLQRYMQYSVEDSAKDRSEAERQADLAEILNELLQQEYPMQQSEVYVDLTYEKGSWQIVVDDTFADALMGGISRFPDQIAQLTEE